MQQTYLTVSSPGNISLPSNINGISGGVATGSASWNVITDNLAGFNMSINASTAHAMVASGDATYYFDNYPTTTAYPSTSTYTWSVPAGQAKFGFTVAPHTGADLVQAFLDNSSNACNYAAGAYHFEKCWVGFNGITATTIISRTNRTDNTGESETVEFKADSEHRLLKSATYYATITTTVFAN